jgi:predicted DsbA family dithiol-disulfide isomerase
MKIQIWSDIACPFCYIGIKQLEQALVHQGLKANECIELKAFELDPYAPVSTPLSIFELLANKYQTSVENIQRNNVHIEKMGEELGITLNIAQIKPTNTLKAHQVVSFAKTKNKSYETYMALFKAYFEDGLNIGLDENLYAITSTLFASKEEYLHVLQNDEYKFTVRQEEQEARNKGINSVPHFNFGQGIELRGAQGIQTFINALKHKASQDQNPNVCDTDSKLC